MPKNLFSLLLPARGKFLTSVLFLFFAMMLVGSNSALANINGAIFTTDYTCSGVNVNSFSLKTDVYLDGGPRKPGSAGLPDGYYYVQVTSPNGQLLGTTDGAADPTPVHVTSGSFDTCYQLWDILIKASDGTQGYDDTPNTGGVYKVWITPSDSFSPGNGVNGFINAWSKTDNFKVEGEGACPNPSIITVRKFDDSDANGVWDESETEIEWLVDVTDPCGSTNAYLTPFDILTSPSGTWQICEQVLNDWLQTALIIDENPTAPLECAAIVVTSDCDEVHEVIFGNIQLGSITACKFLDVNVNGEKDYDEPPVEGIRFTLQGMDILGEIIDQNGVTPSNGCITFDKLLPGIYTLSEILPSNWIATTDPCLIIELYEGNDVSFDFGNICIGTAEFSTKGYWHNKNGLSETVQADFDYLNSLIPWQTPSSYFGAGDEPIDGFRTNGRPIPAAKNASRKIIAPAGTAWAEQSYFLVDRNRRDKREQLAQQLDAFIMNVRHRLTECGPDSVIQKPDGTWVEASELITQAINYWIDGTNNQRTTITRLLDDLNNSSAVLFVPCTPCVVEYPE